VTAALAILTIGLAVARPVGLEVAVPAGVAAAETAEARGDRLWRARGVGFAATGRVDPEPASRAVDAYEEALRDRPGDAALTAKLLEARYFHGHFASADPARAREDFDRMVELAERAVAEARPGSAREAESQFWAAIAWGLWGPSHGYVASVARGVPARIRDHAEALRRIDETYRAGAGPRLLGRLHTQLPKIPLVTGWVDRQLGVALLQRACAISHEDARNALFLAEALLEHVPGSAGEAAALLREVAGRTPAAETIVEDTEIIREARQGMAVLEARHGGVVDRLNRAAQ
jgi:hypothetical protein